MPRVSHRVPHCFLVSPTSTRPGPSPIRSQAHAATMTMNASAAAAKLGVPRMVAVAPSAHVQTLFARLRLPVPAYGQPVAGFTAGAGSGSAASQSLPRDHHAVSSALDDMEADGDEDALQRELSRELNPASAEPVLPDLTQKPFVDPKMSMEQLKKLAGGK
jgi:hypothetical protein